LYKSVVVVGKTAYTSGHLPIDADGKLLIGRLGAEMDVEAGKRAAVLVGLNLLASIRQELGSLDRVGRIIKILGAVNCTPDFTQQPAVVNGCSELLAEVFGPDRGVGARSAIGVGSLPLGVPVEIEAVFEIAD
jgi:enamine deaminase RidA (YjgF/YER057c/UK114 family)